MCYYDPDGGYLDDDNVYGNEIDATKYDIRRKQREEREWEKELEEMEREDGNDW